MTIHVPVLLEETLRLLDPQPGDTVVDATFGAGGHSRAIAARIGEAGTLIAIDRDPEARLRFEAFADEVACATRFVAADFAGGLHQLEDESLEADGVLFDLGVSSPQIDDTDRGFSYSRDAPLDMRMDPGQPVDAAAIVAEWSRRDLSRAFKQHTGLTFVRYVNRLRIARACELLMTAADSVADICFQVGFNNLSNFNRHFLALKGLSPSAFRREHRANVRSHLSAEQPGRASAGAARGGAAPASLPPP